MKKLIPRHLRFVCLAVSLALFICSTLFSKPLILEAYGDSLTAGFLSNTNVCDAPPLPEVSEILSDLFMYAITKNLTLFKKHHHFDLAWPEIVGEYFRVIYGETIVTNYAFSRQKTVDLIHQVKSSGAQSLTTMAFFFIGHNDLCRNTLPTEAIARAYEENIDRSLQVWDSNHINSRVFLIPVGSIHRAFEVLLDVTWFEGEEPNHMYTCMDSWTKYFPYCPQYAQLTQSGKITHYLAPKLSAMNQKLHDLSVLWNTRTINNNRFDYLFVPEDPGFIPEHFAIDCYHLSQQGQQFIADGVIERLIDKNVLP